MLAFNAVHNFCWQLPKMSSTGAGLVEHPDWDADALGLYSIGTTARSAKSAATVGLLPAQLELMDAEIGRAAGRAGCSGARDNTVVRLPTTTAARPAITGDNTVGRYEVHAVGGRHPVR